MTFVLHQRRKKPPTEAGRGLTHGGAFGWFTRIVRRRPCWSDGDAVPWVLVGPRRFLRTYQREWRVVLPRVCGANNRVLKQPECQSCGRHSTFGTELSLRIRKSRHSNDSGNVVQSRIHIARIPHNCVAGDAFSQREPNLEHVNTIVFTCYSALAARKQVALRQRTGQGAGRT